MKNKISVKQQKLIDELVAHFNENRRLFEILLTQVQVAIASLKDLTPLIHSVKFRIKDPDHLKDKLTRKILAANEGGSAFSITRENLFSSINDLVGFRIIHLHTTQIEGIDFQLKKIFDEQNWVLVEGPTARTWDNEYRAYFKKIGIGINDSENLYTSVHYIIKSNSNAEITCEIQVRTLMEEVWGEVDHSINYPHKSKSISCREQIKVLARVTSSCSRLVDSIFITHNDHMEQSAPKPLNSKPSKKKKTP